MDSHSFFLLFLLCSHCPPLQLARDGHLFINGKTQYEAGAKASLLHPLVYEAVAPHL